MYVPKTTTSQSCSLSPALQACANAREFVPSRQGLRRFEVEAASKTANSDKLASQIESPVSHAFSQLSFAMLPVNKPKGKQPFCFRAQCELCVIE